MKTPSYVAMGCRKNDNRGAKWKNCATNSHVKMKLLGKIFDIFFQFLLKHVYFCNYTLFLGQIKNLVVNYGKCWVFFRWETFFLATYLVICLLVRVEEVSMHEKYHRTKSSLSVTLGLHRNYIYKEVSHKENFLFFDTSRS